MIYLDNSATTAPYPQVRAAVAEALEETWANPSSVHGAGMQAQALLASARTAVTRALGVRHASDGRVIFTSGGTEADHLAVCGSVYAKSRPSVNGSRGKILTTDSEHPAVEESMRRLEADGFTVVRIPTRGGALDPDAVRKNAQGAILASFMLVNNESGALYDVAAAFAAVREASPQAVTHTDAVQAFGKVRFSPASLGADLITVSGHKIGGPKGIGALYASAPLLRAKKLVPTLPGGGQEDGYRSGTENVPGIAGFGAACRLLSERFSENGDAVAAVRARILEGLAPLGDAVRLNRPACGVDAILSLTVPGIRSETLLNFFSARGICVSAGSACAARARHLSRAMLAFALKPEDADSTVRVSLSPVNTTDDADAFCAALAVAVRTLQKRR
jgi:cysteine desulfurase